jgi:hypothetical protein
VGLVGTSTVALAAFIAGASGSNTGQGGSSGPYAIGGIVVVVVAVLVTVLLKKR